jgi:hypothetical protein
MQLKWTAEEGASGGEDFDDAAGMLLDWTAEEGASGDEDFGDGAAVRVGLIGASEKEGFCVASGGEVFGGGIASAEEDFKAASDEEEGLWTAVSLMMASLDVVVASDEGEGCGMVAPAKVGLGFCVSSEEEGFVEAMMKKSEVGAATMVGLGGGAAAMAVLEFFA